MSSNSDVIDAVSDALGVSGKPVNYEVIDADAHTNPPPEFWAEYLPAKFRDVAPKFESGDDGIDYTVFEGKRTPFMVMTAVAGQDTKTYKMHGRRDDTTHGGWIPEARIKDMDTDGVDGAVLYGGGPLASQDEELRLASFNAYNRWLADFCSYAPDRLWGIAYLPMLEVADAVEQLREARKLGLKGVLIPAFPQTVQSSSKASETIHTGMAGDAMGSRRYSDEEFDPFWAAAVELGMPVHMHLGARQVRTNPTSLFLPDSVMAKLAMAEPIAILTFGGVFDRHPDLKFVTVESGVGWFAFVAQFMDRIYEKHQHWTHTSLKKMPSEYMDTNVYGTFMEERAGLLLRNEPGCKNIMWSSDYPHSETTFPHSRQAIDRMFEGIPEADKRAIVCDNALKLYGIK